MFFSSSVDCCVFSFIPVASCNVVKLALDWLPGTTFKNVLSVRIASMLKMQKRSSFKIPLKESFPYVSDSRTNR